MSFTFQKLRPEYERLSASALVTHPRQAQAIARDILDHRAAYEAIASRTGVPVLFLGPIDVREHTSRLGLANTYLGNGQSLARRTTIMPKGRGPFRGKDAFVRGGIDALTLLSLDGLPPGTWTLPFCCYQWEHWNGFGYRQWHGVRSPYLWGWTSHQQAGKYVRDGVWNASAWDPQPGCFALAIAMLKLDPTLRLAA